MIARICLLLLVVIVVPDVYIYRRYIARRQDLSRLLKWAWWLPNVVLCVYTLCLSAIRDFAPDNMMWLNIYLFLIGLIVIPKDFFLICSLIGRLFRRLFRLRRNYGNYVGILVVLGLWHLLFYASVVGVHRLEVHHVDLDFPDLPEAFDGYRIVQFSDAHLGTISEELLRHVVDSIQAQRPDLIAFTGDLVNIKATEAERYSDLLSSLKAPDGVVAVLGNHDYSMYINVPEADKQANEQRLITLERRMGWQLLRNEHISIGRGHDSLVIAGEENDGRKPFPSRADMKKTLHGVSPNAFVVMLQHDPSAWQRSILPHSNAQLTLSGHTHGGQFSVFGWRPTQLSYDEDFGLYNIAGRRLYVSCGIGGVVPLRYNMPAEVVVISLHRTQKQK